MLLAVIAILVGVGLLAYAADQFVLGAARVALVKKVPSLVVGVVIVGFGTSAPEMLVSALAAFGDEPEVAIGNVVGSNIANLSLLLGIGAIMVPLAVDSRTVKREAMLVIAAVAVFALAVQGGGIGRVEGVVMLVAMAAALFVVTRTSTGDPLGPEVVELADVAEHRFGVEVARTVLGLIGTIGGSQLLLWGGLEVAAEAGLSEGFVGATMVAIGTSLPELASSLLAAWQGKTDIAVGNVVGSNLFNILLIIGATSALQPLPVSPAMYDVELPAMVGFAVLGYFLMHRFQRLSRVSGAMLFTLFIGFTAWQCWAVIV